MTENQMLERMKQDRLVAIIRGVALADIASVAEALYQGGIRWLEVTFNQRGDGRDTVKSIARVRELRMPGLSVGAGTVMTMEQVRQAKDVQAEFIISPDGNADVIRETKALGMLSMPGAMTPTEVARCSALGADVVKIFPCGVLGAGYLKAIREPLNHIPIAAVGGITVENAASFLQAGASMLGIGSSLTPRDAIVSGDFQQLTVLAQAFVSAIG